jgi:hypothetical protein
MNQLPAYPPPLALPVPPNLTKTNERRFRMNILDAREATNEGGKYRRKGAEWFIVKGREKPGAYLSTASAIAEDWAPDTSWNAEYLTKKFTHKEEEGLVKRLCDRMDAIERDTETIGNLTKRVNSLECESKRVASHVRDLKDGEERTKLRINMINENVAALQERAGLQFMSGPKYTATQIAQMLDATRRLDTQNGLIRQVLERIEALEDIHPGVKYK